MVRGGTCPSKCIVSLICCPEDTCECGIRQLKRRTACCRVPVKWQNDDLSQYLIGIVVGVRTQLLQGLCSTTILLAAMSQCCTVPC